jgi:hypothetical protein
MTNTVETSLLKETTMSIQKCAIALALLACLVIAGVSAQEVLNPKMTAEKGTTEKPFGKLGKATNAPWSQTTVAAAVDNKPLPGKVVTVVGEIIDLSCYTSLGKHGGKHRDCGQKCVKAGEPVGLLEQNGTVYILMAEEHDQRRDGKTTFRDVAVENMAYIMEITGTLSEVKGIKTIHVQGYVKK